MTSRQEFVRLKNGKFKSKGPYSRIVLRESLSGYNAVLDTENCNIAPKKAWFQTGLNNITDG